MVKLRHFWNRWFYASEEATLSERDDLIAQIAPLQMRLDAIRWDTKPRTCVSIHIAGKEVRHYFFDQVIDPQVLLAVAKIERTRPKALQRIADDPSILDHAIDFYDLSRFNR